VTESSFSGKKNIFSRISDFLSVAALLAALKWWLKVLIIIEPFLSNRGRR